MNEKTPAEILEKRARLLAQKIEDSQDEEDFLYLVVFLLGNERFAIDLLLVQEAQPLDTRTWSPVPCTPDFIVGAVNIRGRVFSVMDAARFLGLPARQISEEPFVLLVKGGAAPDGHPLEIGILTDAMPYALKIPLSEIHPAAAVVSGKNQKYIRGVSDDMITVLDLEQLLSDPLIIVEEEV